MAADAASVDAAIDAVRTEYGRLLRRTRAVHEMKITVKRAAVARARRQGDARADAPEAEAEAAEAERDAAIDELEREMEREIVRAKTVVREEIEEEVMRREAIERHLEEERRRAAEAEAGAGPEALRSQLGVEEQDTYEDADDHRTTSPEGTPRPIEGTSGEVKGNRANAFQRLKTTLHRKTSGGTDESEKALDEEMREPAVAEEATIHTKTPSVTMAALAPKPVPMMSMSQLAPKPIEQAPKSTHASDPLKDMVQRLQSSKVGPMENRVTSAPRERVEKNETIVSATATKVPRAFHEPMSTRTVAAKERSSDPFAPPRGLSAAVKALVGRENPSERTRTIEDAFGMPQATYRAPALATFPETPRVNADAFAPEPQSAPIPAAPVHVEPNPYVMSARDLQPRKRVGMPKPSQGLGLDHGATRAPAAPDVGPTKTEVGAQKRDRGLALLPPNEFPAPDSPVSDSATAVVLKPKIPRGMVPHQPFKVSEIRNIFSYARHGRYDEMKKLIVKGVPLDARDEHGNTPLIIASQNGQGRCVKLLIRSGADPNAQNKRGNTALHFTLHFRFDAISDFIQKHGGMTNIRNFDGATCFEFVG